MERSVEVLAVILFGVIGLSHLLQPLAWVDYFVLLRGKGAPGNPLAGHRRTHERPAAAGLSSSNRVSFLLTRMSMA
jgi:hypothetical protein